MKTLYLVRHAHRDITDRTLDNGLSPKGHAQAARLTAWFEGRGVSAPIPLETSPRLRCRETLEPLAKAWGLPLAVNPAAEEQRHSETPEQFGRRVMAWQEQWLGSGPETLILCSHGDWIPMVIALFCGKRVDVSKGSVSILQLGPGKGARPSLEIVQQP